MVVVSLLSAHRLHMVLSRVHSDLSLTPCVCTLTLRCMHFDLRGAHAAGLDVGGDCSEHRGRQGQVEQAVASALVFNLEQLTVQILKGIFLSVRALHVGVDRPEGFYLC